MKYKLQLQFTEVKTKSNYTIVKPDMSSTDVEAAIGTFLKSVEDGTNQLMNIVVQLDLSAKPLQ
jgi:hypothetical protein